MNTCDSCQYWSQPEEEWNTSRYGQCLHGKLQADSCEYPADGLSGGEPAECTVISTGPSFGCIHHEPK